MSEKEKIVKQIKEVYEPKTKTKYDELIALNKRVELPAYIFAYTFGIIASLILGLGMCLAMQVIGTGIPLMVLGIVIGVIGIALVSVNYPIFLAIMKSRKKKYAEKIIALSDELLTK
ncbi:MAG: dihydropteridine reductase [Clostridia bacterium]|nr:dihydropteridine reductase [Clostridia bacterium]